MRSVAAYITVYILHDPKHDHKCAPHMQASACKHDNICLTMHIAQHLRFQQKGACNSPLHRTVSSSGPRWTPCVMLGASCTLGWQDPPAWLLPSSGCCWACS
jgi:hypothetical protein